MPVKIACPKCKKQYQLPDSALGKSVQCKECSTVFKTRARAAAQGSPAGRPKQPAQQQRRSPLANPQELAQFGIDGPIRKQADIFSSPPPQGSLGNLMEDPGFADVKVAREEVEQESEGRDKGMDNILNNPYATQAGQKKKSKKAKSADYSINSEYQYKPLGLLATFASIGVGLNILCILGIFVLIAFVPSDEAVGEMVENEDATQIIAMGLGILAGVLGLVVTLIFAAVFVCMFMYRAMANLLAMGGQGFNNSPGWCAGGFFVPFVNFYQPFMAMSEIARGSTEPRGKAWTKMSPPVLAVLWWACYIVGGILNRVSDRLVDMESTVDYSLYLAAAGYSLLVIAGVFLICLIWNIVGKQNQHAEAAGLR